MSAIDAAPRDARAPLFNRLGDLYLKAADERQAIKAFGMAVDTYLENGHFDPAAALCRRMIALSPNIVRARCTLAFLSLSKGLVADAETEIEGYVRAARKSGTDELAVARLRMMADATDDHEIRLALGTQLADLGDVQGSDAVFGAVYAERNGLRSLPQEDQRERWARLLRTTITGADLDTPPFAELTG